MLNLSYELEGLITLLINRGDAASPQIEKLVAEKAAALSAMAAGAPVAETTAAPSCPPAYVTEEQKADLQETAEAATKEQLDDAEPATPVRPVAETDTRDEKISLDEKIARESVCDIRTAFSINDKFRFRRELFGNSAADYDDALEVIAAMSSLDEAEDYFYNDLCWEPNNDNVKDFMEIVGRYFSR